MPTKEAVTFLLDNMEKPPMFSVQRMSYLMTRSTDIANLSTLPSITELRVRLSRRALCVRLCCCGVV